MSSSNEKNLKFFCGTKHPSKEQVKKYKKKKKMSQRINDGKSVYIREDVAYELINYINLSVIEADEFRTNLGITNSQSIRIEREMVAIIMKTIDYSYLSCLICAFLLIN